MVPFTATAFQQSVSAVVFLFVVLLLILVLLVLILLILLVLILVFVLTVLGFVVLLILVLIHACVSRFLPMKFPEIPGRNPLLLYHNDCFTKGTSLVSPVFVFLCT